MLITSCAELGRNFKWLVRVRVRATWLGLARYIFRVTVRVRVGVRDLLVGGHISKTTCCKKFL